MSLPERLREDRHTDIWPFVLSFPVSGMITQQLHNANSDKVTEPLLTSFLLSVMEDKKVNLTEYCSI